MDMASSASASTFRRARLTRQGTAYLTNYARTVNPYPQKEEKQDLLDALHSMPGNESFTLQKLSNWFVRHRNSLGDAHAHDDESVLFPKLTPTQLQQLRVLYKNLSDPPDGVITFWAGRIKAAKAEISSWIQYQKAKEFIPESSPEMPLRQGSDSASVSPTMSEFPRPHLPTPAKSPSISPQTRMPSLPPIAVKVEEEKLPYYHRPSLSRSETLAASIRDTLGYVSTEQPPKTADEFAAKFARVENMIEGFMKKYESGQLVRLGWESQ